MLRDTHMGVHQLTFCLATTHLYHNSKERPDVRGHCTTVLDLEGACWGRLDL